MSEVLSQEEIDALLKGVSGGEIETETEAADVDEGIISYDLANQEKIIRGRMPTLEIVNQRFSRDFRTTMSSMLRKLVDVSPLSVDTIKFGDFLKSLPVPSSLHLFKMEPLRGYSLCAMDSKLVFALIDIFFGGDGASILKVEGRDFTPIEDRMIRRVIIEALDDYQRSWEPVHKLTFEYVRSEMNPQFVTIVPPSDIVITTVFELEIEDTTGTLTICIPYSNIEPIRSKLYAGFQTERLEVDSNWIRRLKKLITTLEIEMRVKLSEKELTVEEILNLKEGDIISFNQDIDEPLTAEIEEIPKYKVIPGIIKSNKAVKIKNLIHNEEI